MPGTEVGDELIGDRILAEARKLSKPRLIIKTGRHRAQQITLWEDAYCVIQKRKRFLK